VRATSIRHLPSVGRGVAPAVGVAGVAGAGVWRRLWRGGLRPWMERRRIAGAEGGEIAAVGRCGRRGQAADLARQMAAADGNESRRARARMETNRGVLAAGRTGMCGRLH
jgi:hypothetical protein